MMHLRELRFLVPAAIACAVFSSSCASHRDGASAPASDGRPARPAAADQPAAPRSPDSHNAYEPRGEPGDGQKYLEQMAGEWDVVKTFFPRDGGAPAVTKGMCTQKMTHGGRFLESEFLFQDKEGETTGTGVIGYDPQTKLFTSFWYDSRSTRFSPRKSAEPFDGSKITLAGAAVGEAPSAGGRKSRTVSVLEEGNTRLVHRQWSINPDGSERLVMQMEMTRRAK